MDDKLMDDFDTDFITGILSSSGELQMADNLMQDLMGELDANSQLQDVVADVMAVAANGGGDWNGQQQQQSVHMMHQYSNQTASPNTFNNNIHQSPHLQQQQHLQLNQQLVHSNHHQHQQHQYENSNQMHQMTINTSMATASGGQMLMVSPTLNQTNYTGYDMMPHQQQQIGMMSQQQQQQQHHPFLISPNSDSNMAPIQTQMIMSNASAAAGVNSPLTMQFVNQGQSEYSFGAEMAVPGVGLQQAPMLSHQQQQQQQQQLQYQQAAPVEPVSSNKRGRKNLKDILKDDNNFIKTIPTPATIAAIASRGENKQKQQFGGSEMLQYDSSSTNQLVKIKSSGSRSISSLIGGQSQLLNSSNEMSTTISPVLSPNNNNNNNNNFSLPPTPLSPNFISQHHHRQQQPQQQQHFVVDSNSVLSDSSSKLVKLDSPGGGGGIQILLDSNSNSNSNDMVLPVSPIDFKPLTSLSSPADQAPTSTAGGHKGRPSKADKSNSASDKASGKSKKPKVQKRTAHNAIEKKYRSSINDKICELKNKVAGPNAKLQKSGILRSALDFIYNIENASKRLHDENVALRNALNSISLNYTNPSAIQTILSSINLNSASASIKSSQSMPVTPPISSPEDSQQPDSPSSSSSSSSSGTQPSTPVGKVEPERQSGTNKRPHKMMRTVLCMCVLSVLIFNPFSLVVPSDDGGGFQQFDGAGSIYQSSQVVNSRVLNSVNTAEEEVTMATNSSGAQARAGYGLGFLVSWLLNMGLIAMLMVWLFVTGEDYGGATSSNEKSSSAVLSFYQRASKTFSQKKYFESFDACEKGLRELGRSVPRTKAQLLAGIAWQLARLVLDRLYIGRWLSRYAVWLRGIKSMNSFKLSALFYYEMHKFSYLNLKSHQELQQLAASKTDASLLIKTFENGGKLIQTTWYSRLSALYFMLACYNTCEMYNYLESQTASQSLSARDKYNLSEFYFAFALYLTFYLPSTVSRPLVNTLVNKKLLVKFTDDFKQDAESTAGGRCKLNKLKSFLNNKVFVQFMNDFGYLTSFNQAYATQAKLFGGAGTESDQKAYIELKDLDRQKLLSLISFKRKLLSSSFLYDSDDKMDSFAVGDSSNNNSAVVSSVTGSVACDFLMTRFQDYVLFRLTDHIISHSGMTSPNRIAAKSSSSSSLVETLDYMNNENVFAEDQDEEAKADLDQQEFDNIKQIYERNLDYFSGASGRNNLFTAHSSVQQDTQFILLEFLNMLNNWKLRKFAYKCHKTSELRNVRKSEFLDAVVSILKAYECVFDSSDKRSVEHCKRAIELLNNFNENKSTSGFGTNNHLVEKFELLIYDWILSSQTYLWTKKRSADLDLFNQTLKKFKKIAVNYPQINYKIQMYETVMMYTSNRNPVNLVNQPAAKQFLFSKSNQDALYSMNFLLKKFHLQIIE